MTDENDKKGTPREGGQGGRRRRRRYPSRRRQANREGTDAANTDAKDSNRRGDGSGQAKRDGQPRREGDKPGRRRSNRNRRSDGKRPRQGGGDQNEAAQGRQGTGGQRRTGGDAAAGSPRSRDPNRKRRPRRRGPRRSRSEAPPPPAEMGPMGRVSEAPEPLYDPEPRDYAEMTDGELTFLKTTKINDELLFEELPDYDFKEKGNLADVVGIKLHEADPIIPFDARDTYLQKGDSVVVETKRGLTLGTVVTPTTRRFTMSKNMPRVIRKMSQGDTRQQTRNRDKEEAAYRLCKDRIERLKLAMKLVNVEYLHGGNKAVFYFSADGRVDFRELVRDLAQRLHTRIEMRQIGVRDVARKVGGVGICGCQLCCNLYLRDFKPISIRMAKDQNLVLNPQKVSGICGRLLCCLTYENDVYKAASKGMPKIGRRVVTPDGDGRIRDRDVLKRMVRVQLNEEAILREYAVDEVRPASSGPSVGNERVDPALEALENEDLGAPAERARNRNRGPRSNDPRSNDS